MPKNTFSQKCANFLCFPTQNPAQEHHSIGCVFHIASVFILFPRTQFTPEEKNSQPTAGVYPGGVWYVERARTSPLCPFLTRNISETTGDMGSLLLGAFFMKVAGQNRLVTSPMTS